MRTILLWGASSCERKEEIGNALAFVSAVISIYQTGDFNAVTISRFLEQPLQEISSQSKATATQLILAAEDVTAGVRGQEVPQSLQEALVDPFKGSGVVSTRDWPLWLVKSKQSSQQKKKVFSDSSDSIHLLPLPPFVQNNFQF